MLWNGFKIWHIKGIFMDPERHLKMVVIVSETKIVMKKSIPMLFNYQIEIFTTAHSTYFQFTFVSLPPQIWNSISQILEFPAIFSTEHNLLKNANTERRKNYNYENIIEINKYFFCQIDVVCKWNEVERKDRNSLIFFIFYFPEELWNTYLFGK